MSLGKMVHLAFVHAVSPLRVSSMRLCTAFARRNRIGTSCSTSTRTTPWMSASTASTNATGAASAPAQPIVKKLADYSPPPFNISRVELTFELAPENTRVRSILSIEPNPSVTKVGGQRLELDGDKDMRLVPESLKLDGRILAPSEYEVTSEGLKILSEVSSPVVLESEVLIDPIKNRALEGLYMSGGNFATQCEAEGFRRITFFFDRPDVMAIYSTTVIASQEAFPVLLSNGDLVEAGFMEDGVRHYAKYFDPFPKPCYLFALVAGNLVNLEDTFTTKSGKDVRLRIYVRHGDLDRCSHAMESLKRAMKWDEKEYGREYDLQVFNVVAVDDFNMGAMENKSLNIFNSKYVLANKNTATDSDFNGIESVIAHEYFHNWTGNRVTCRDWFQLSLKEGLTVFRDQEFSGDMGSRSVNRIQNVVRLRESQFPEDAGPMAHPVRPESYIEINNFYTATVYQKGAEVIRMLQTLVGKGGFRKGTDLYFARNDGKAVTCDEWIYSIQRANRSVNLSQFKLWYSQAGTPRVSVDIVRDGSRVILNMTQSIPETPDRVQKEPMLIPIAVGLITPSEPTPDVSVDEDDPPSATKVLHLSEAEQSFTLLNVPEDARMSILREFSAPVKLSVTYAGVEESDEVLCLQMARDQDEFNRWEASQKLATRVMVRRVQAMERGESAGFVPPAILQSFRDALLDATIDDSIKAQVLTLPSERWIAGQFETSNPEVVHDARVSVKNEIGAFLYDGFIKCLTLKAEELEGFDLDPLSVGRRALRGVARSYLTGLGDKRVSSECLEQVTGASNMTDALSSLSALIMCESGQREAAIANFYTKWKGNYLVIDKWLRLQAMSPRRETLDDVKALLEHEAFDISNPNNVYALVGGFCIGNPFGFHSRKEESYQFLADMVIQLDRKNPQVASRMVSAFNSWRKCDKDRQELMVSQLRRIAETPNLSKGVFEIVRKALPS